MKKVFSFLIPKKIAENVKILAKTCLELSTLSKRVNYLKQEENKVKAFLELIQIMYKFQESNLLEKAIRALGDESEDLLEELNFLKNYLENIDERHNLADEGEAINANSVFFYCRGAKEIDLMPISYILNHRSELESEIRPHSVNGMVDASEWYVLNDILANTIISDIADSMESVINGINQNFK